MPDDQRDRKNDTPAGRGQNSGSLPPPAFPPGQRAQPRANHRPAPPRSTEEEGDVFPDDAFISPDEPIVRTGARIAKGAFISPDEPMPHRENEEIDPDNEEIDPDEVVVTGMDHDPHLTHEDLAISRQGDPILADLAGVVGRLADDLRDRGESALRTTSDMDRFEATLRAYCVGYLATRRDRESD